MSVSKTDPEFWHDQEVVIIGGTGTLGRALTKELLSRNVGGIRIFSRGELEQSRMRRDFKGTPNIQFLIGDVKDYERVKLAVKGASVVVNAAAMKHVDICEFNPLEAVSTNIKGAENVIRACLEQNVDRVMHISTDKAVYPVNLYGSTKAVTERLFVQANLYTGGRAPMFSCCRYGNVVGSRGSVVEMFREQYAKTNKLSITHPDMTRFLILAERAVEFIRESIEEMSGGEIFIPVMAHCKVIDLARAAVKNPRAELTMVGLRPGEKLAEDMISEEESPYVDRLEEIATFGKVTVGSPMFHSPKDQEFCWDSEVGMTSEKFAVSQLGYDALVQMLEKYDANK